MARSSSSLPRVTQAAKGCSGHRPPHVVLEVRRNGDRLVASGFNSWLVTDEPLPEIPVLIYGVRPTEWLRLRREVFARDGFRCTYCESEARPLHCDHRMPWSRGGATTLANLTTACQPCNNGKRDRTAEEWIEILRARARTVGAQTDE